MARPRKDREISDNTGARNGRFKGVRMRKWGTWVAEVRQPNSRGRIWLGSYKTAEEAARAYDAATFCLRGESAKLNFPYFLPEIPEMDAELTPAQIQDIALKHSQRGGEDAELGVPLMESGGGFLGRSGDVEVRTENLTGAFRRTPGVCTL